MPNFNNTETAFALKSNAQLKRAYWLFKLVANRSLVSFGKGLTNLAFKLRLPIKSLVKATIYDQFVGGESIEECRYVIDNLHAHNVHALLDYSAEGKETEKDFEACKQKILDTIAYAKSKDGMPFAVFKVTGLARFALLEKVSANGKLNKTETAEWDRAKTRIEEICKAGFDENIRVLIDAEETWIQDAIDRLVQDMMLKYNRKKVIIFNTLQMYRTDRLDFLKASLNHAVEHNYYCGLKLVRGAYMEKERARAKEMNYPDPIHKTKKDSDICYDAGTAFLLDHLDRMSLFAGTHNENSSAILADLIVEKGLAKNHEHIWFSQLYGMSDNLTFNLANDGYNVVKYVPFGPVSDTLPYLIRRAEENTSAAGQTGRELRLIKMELERRRLS